MKQIKIKKSKDNMLVVESYRLGKKVNTDIALCFSYLQQYVKYCDMKGNWKVETLSRNDEVFFDWKMISKK